MSKGKEAIASKTAEIKKLKELVNKQFAEITQLKNNEKHFRIEIMQLLTYKARVAELNQATEKIKQLEKEVIDAEKLIDLWAYRATVLAQADRDLDESMFSSESLGVLSDMNMLPKGIANNRLAKRNAKKGSRLKKHMKVIDSAIKDVNSKGIRGIEIVQS